MDKKMSLMGVGRKIAMVLILSVIITASINFLTKPIFNITENYPQLIVIAIAMVAVGFTLNLISAFSLMKAYQKEQLATKGFYSIFLNPMYTFQIFLTVPGLLLFLNSWLVMISVIPTFIAFKIYIKEEETYLAEKFGDQYKEYKEKVLFKYL